MARNTICFALNWIVTSIENLHPNWGDGSYTNNHSMKREHWIVIDLVSISLFHEILFCFNRYFFRHEIVNILFKTNEPVWFLTGIGFSRHSSAWIGFFFQKKSYGTIRRDTNRILFLVVVLFGLYLFTCDERAYRMAFTELCVSRRPRSRREPAGRRSRSRRCRRGSSTGSICCRWTAKRSSSIRWSIANETPP